MASAVLGGLVATAYALDLLVTLMPADVSRLARIGVNERVLAFTAGLVVLTAGRGGRAAPDAAGRRDEEQRHRGQRRCVERGDRTADTRRRGPSAAIGRAFEHARRTASGAGRPVPPGAAPGGPAP